MSDLNISREKNVCFSLISIVWLHFSHETMVAEKILWKVKMLTKLQKF